MIDNKNLDQVLYCKKCNNNFSIIVNKKIEKVIHEGYLKCDNCNDRYNIIEDIIFIEKKINSKTVEYQSKIYSYWWNESHKDINYDKGDTEKILYSTLSLKNKDFENKIVLDAGCGNGRFSDLISNSNPKLFVIADVSDGIYQAKKNIENKNINFIAIKGDLNIIPFKSNTFEIIYSWGVIHHTPNPRFTFNNISKFCRINGKFSIYLYKQNPDYKYNNKHIRLIAILRQYLVIYPLRFISQFLSEKNVIRLFRPIRLIEKFFNYGVVGCHSTKYKFEKKHYFRVVIDRFKTKYASEHQEYEIINWYKENKFNDLVFGTEPKIGVIGTKKDDQEKDINVTFRYL